MRVGINPRLALMNRVALPFVWTPVSNEILSENLLVERDAFGTRSYKSAGRSRNAAALTLASINRWLDLSRMVAAKTSSFLVP
jgi:hypothetical protein